MACDKRTARELYEDLQEVAKRIPAQIDAAPDDGPLIQMICDHLVKGARCSTDEGLDSALTDRLTVLHQHTAAEGGR